MVNIFWQHQKGIVRYWIIGTVGNKRVSLITFTQIAVLYDLSVGSSESDSEAIL